MLLSAKLPFGESAQGGAGAEAATTAAGSWGEALPTLLKKLRVMFANCHIDNMLVLEFEPWS